MPAEGGQSFVIFTGVQNYFHIICGCGKYVHYSKNVLTADVFGKSNALALCMAWLERLSPIQDVDVSRPQLWQRQECVPVFQE